MQADFARDIALKVQKCRSAPTFRLLTMHYAHSTSMPDCSNWQILPEHLAAVAWRSFTLGEKFGAGKAAALAGWLHDLGKYSQEFQLYVRGLRSSGGDHSTAGARQVFKVVSGRGDLVVADLLAYVIAGHHAGLPDQLGERGSLTERLNKQAEQLDEAWHGALAFDAKGLWPGMFKPQDGRAPNAFQLAFLGRMIFSCLVDADFLDTESFYAEVDGRLIDRTWPVLGEHIDILISVFARYMDGKQSGSDEKTSNLTLNELRSRILDHARSKAELEPGIFTLNVPTGGGKTLTSLAFALDHAKRWRKDRIIYAIPFTSIIDQTAKIFRDVLGDDFVLEHHSAIELGSFQAERDLDRGTDDAKLRLATENWQAPVVITTNVQLFESLFASRTSRCRKLHNLTNAVIILDEAQTIPLHVLRPCVTALDELARNYGCTIVLCTATQPALAVPRFKDGFDVGPGRELAPDPHNLHRVLRRTTQRLAGEMTDDALVGEISGVEQALVIVNSRPHALKLYELGKQQGMQHLIHLTTRQTAADRSRILADIRAKLDAGRPCRVIATSLIEAGVDIDFPRVWRAEAGADQLVQAAGRANREGRRPVEDSIVTIFKPADAKPPGEIAALIGGMYRILEDHKGDLFSPQAIEAYFREVYWQRGDAGLDRIHIKNADGQVVATQSLKLFSMGSDRTDFCYRTVAEAFRLIQSGMEPVIVAIDDEPKRTLEALGGRMPPGAAARELQNYIVQVPPEHRQKLIENGHARFVEGFGDQFAVLISKRRYSREKGLIWENADELNEERSFI